MLAQNFKTPANLKITAAEFDALAKVLGMLERGELVDWKVGDKTDFGFAIGCQYEKDECGTMACIGGWAAILMHHPDPTDYVNSYMVSGKPIGQLGKLYWDYPMNATVAHAAIALRNFLTTGKPRWDEALI